MQTPWQPPAVNFTLTLSGVPTSLSFFTMRSSASCSSTTAVAAMRQLAGGRGPQQTPEWPPHLQGSRKTISFGTNVSKHVLVYRFD